MIFINQRPTPEGLEKCIKAGVGRVVLSLKPLERDLREGHEWDLQTLCWADEFGFTEAWRDSMRLLVEEVAPRVVHLKPRPPSNVA